MPEPKTEPRLKQTSLLSFFKVAKKQPVDIPAVIPVKGVPIVLDTQKVISPQSSITIRAAPTPCVCSTPLPSTPDVEANSVSNDISDDDDVPLGVFLSRACSALDSTQRTNIKSFSFPPKRTRVQLQLDFGQEIASSGECLHCGMVFTNTEEDMQLHKRLCKKLTAASIKRDRKDTVTEMFPDIAKAPRQHTARRTKDALTQKKKRAAPTELRPHDALALLQRCTTIETVSSPQYDTLSHCAFVLDGSRCALWLREEPRLLDLLTADCPLSVSMSLLSGSTKLHHHDARNDESYHDHPENIVVVLMVERSSGACTAAVVGREHFRDHGVEETTIPAPHDGSNTPPTVRCVRRRTRCDVVQVWVRRDAQKKTSELRVGTPTSLAVDRDALLFEHLLATAPRTSSLFQPTPRSASSGTQGPRSESYGDQVRTALSILGDRIVYGCRVSWKSECAYASSCFSSTLSDWVVEELFDGESPRWRYDDDADACEEDVMLSDARALAATTMDSDSDDRSADGDSASLCSNSSIEFDS